MPLKSNCCHAPIHVSSDGGTTRWYVCGKCAKACDPTHEYATALRDGYEVPLIGVPKSAAPSKGDFREDDKPIRVNKKKQ